MFKCRVLFLLVCFLPFAAVCAASETGLVKQVRDSRAGSGQTEP